MMGTVHSGVANNGSPPEPRQGHLYFIKTRKKILEANKYTPIFLIYLLCNHTHLGVIQ